MKSFIQYIECNSKLSHLGEYINESKISDLLIEIEDKYGENPELNEIVNFLVSDYRFKSMSRSEIENYAKEIQDLMDI